MHRGVPDRSHGIYDWNVDLTEIDAKFPPVWKMLAQQGVKVGLFGSLHSYGSYPTGKELKESYLFYVPDVFSPDEKCYPENLSKFQKFCLAMIRSSARNVSTKMELPDLIPLFVQLGKLGLQKDTGKDVAKHLLLERVNPWVKTRRRTYHALLAFDVYLKLLRRTKPEFTTFFANNLAAAMHRYWAAAFPEDYPQFEMTQEWRETYRNEIDWAMSKFDGCYQRLIEFVDANPEYRLVVASGMGQAATIAKHLYTEVYIKDLMLFMSRMGVDRDGWTFVPAMFPWFNIRVTGQNVEIFRKSIEELRIAGEPVLYNEYKDGLFALFLGHQDLDHSYAYLGNKRMDFSELGLANVRNEDLAQRTGYHIPEGSLLVYDPKGEPEQRHKTRERVSSLDIAPSLLRSFGVNPPRYMTDGAIAGIV